MEALGIFTEPPAGEKAEQGTTVQINVSDNSEIDSGSGNSPLSPSWYPEGYFSFSENLAYQWVAGGPNPCSGISCKYNTINIVSKTGCPSGVYAEANYLSNGVIVDWSNDSVPSLSSGQIAQLQFQTFDNAAGTAELVKISCH